MNCARNVSGLARLSGNIARFRRLSTGTRVIDMTGAAGYEVQPDEEVLIPRKNLSTPLTRHEKTLSNRRLAHFASRLGNLTAEDLRGADGYIWMGQNIPKYSQLSLSDIWDDIVDEDVAIKVIETDGDVFTADTTTQLPSTEVSATKDLVAKRRYNGGQVRRMRKLREARKNREANRRVSSRPKRKKKNSLIEEDE